MSDVLVHFWCISWIQCYLKSATDKAFKKLVAKGRIEIVALRKKLKLIVNGLKETHGANIGSWCISGTSKNENPDIEISG